LFISTLQRNPPLFLRRKDEIQLYDAITLDWSPCSSSVNRRWIKGRSIFLLEQDGFSKAIPSQKAATGSGLGFLPVFDKSSQF
jgi:hypothetical protein